MSMLDQHEHKRPTHDFDGIIENRIQSPPPYFTVLFYGLIIWGVAYCAYFLLSGWSSEGEFKQEMAQLQEQVSAAHPAEPEMKKAPAAAAKEEDDEEGSDSSVGEELFAANCASCHGAEGEGGIGPDLTDETYRYGRTLEAITTSIASGRPEGMPAFGNQLSKTEIDAVASFVLEMRK